MIKIRLQRHGARHAPFYRMVVAPSQARRDGKFIGVLGTYNPQAHKREEELKLKIDRVDHWLGVGAQPTDTAKSLIRQGRMSPEEWLKRADKLADAKLKRKSKGDTAPSMEAPAEEEKKEEEPKAEEAASEEPKAEEKPVEEAMEEAPAEEGKEGRRTQGRGSRKRRAEGRGKACRGSQGGRSASRKGKRKKNPRQRKPQAKSRRQRKSL